MLPFLAACLGVASFSLMDALMKEASLAIGALSALFWRNVLGIGLGAPLWVASGGAVPRRPGLRLHVRRAIVAAMMTFLFFWALTRLPIAETVAISFISPIIALGLARLLLGERIGRPAVFASLLGTAGMFVILSGRLVGDYEPEALVGIGAVLLSATLFAYNLILSRQLALVATPIEIAFFQSLLVALLLLPLFPLVSLPGGPAEWRTIALAALLALFSLAILGWAYARAEAQALIPVEYTGFVWAALFGWLFFAERPGVAVLAGAALIVGGSLIAARARPESGRPEPSGV